MRYFGGKSRLAKDLAAVINSYKVATYHEPFCGAFSVGSLVHATRTASDLQPDIVLLLAAVRDGWVGPETLNEEEYNELKNSSPSALRAFAGFGCSNSGKFFGGYARESTGRNFAANASASLNKLRPLLSGVAFTIQDYRDYAGKVDLIYCDPPYSQTTGYTVGPFCSDEFWSWARCMARQSIVLVSEYTGPPWAEVVWEKPVRTDMNGKRGKLERVEKLYRVIP